MTHSPTPWNAEKTEYGFYVQGPHDVKIAFCGNNAMFSKDGYYSISKTEAKANAEFIVTAVNAYEANQTEIAELKERLKMLADEIDINEEELFDWEQTSEKNQALIRQLVEALEECHKVEKDWNKINKAINTAIKAGY